MLIDFIAIFLIEWLGHDNFKQRELAQYVTNHYNKFFDCRNILIYHAQYNPDAEVRLRCKRAVKKYTLLDPTKGYYPRLDWMDYEDGDEISKIMKENPHHDYGYPTPENYVKDQKYRKLSEQYALSLLNSGLTRYQVRSIMDRAVKQELKQGKIPIKE